MNGGAVLGVVAGVAISLEWFAHRLLGPRHPVGDEYEYLARGRAEDPFAPEPFLRVPLVSAIARVTDEARFRAAFGLLSAATVVLTAAAALILVGPLAALVCGLLLALLPDRAVLSQHLWPDVPLAFWHAASLLVLVRAALIAPLPWWIPGLLLAGMCATRLEAAAMLPVFAYLYRVLAGVPAAGLLWLWVPSVVLLLAWTIRNGVRYGIWLPDTTWWFNLAVLDVGTSHRARDVDHNVAAVFASWSAQPLERRSAASRALRRSLARPGRWLRGVFGRAHQMLGPDSFAIGKLLDATQGVYPRLEAGSRRRLGLALRFSFPLLASLAATAAALGPPVLRLTMLPAAVGFVVICLVHSRTRYRQALLPYLTLAAAWTVTAGLESAPWCAVGLAAALAAVTVSATSRLTTTERRQRPAPGLERPGAAPDGPPDAKSTRPR